MKGAEEKGWQERLLLACNNEADTQEEEERYFREVAEAAPLDELELFLDKPSARYTESARAVMRQVYRTRMEEIRRREAKAAARSEWWWGLLQQAWAQVVSGMIVGVLSGLVAGWFVFSP
ncbi:hypothetical protein CK501_14540 [Halovibrio salipaludis]|uniref:Uncharacterized protein n=1 Tax=Halovibrio salipaludis TaxID=2032626 RepID=A0A2A2EWZ1_9GAMM|nr:hypothetical protein [Halovibrio salipaludis]PAU77676.1 hypothetical protein CK501_14540 [Halovibrio salipaludis]